jgi:hypothetical protein
MAPRGNAVAAYRLRASQAALLCQLLQCFLRFGVQSARRFAGEIPARRTTDEDFGGGEISRPVL